MDEMQQAIGDIWSAVKNDSANLIEQAGMDPAVFGPIIGALVVGFAIWFVLSNVLG